MERHRANVNFRQSWGATATSAPPPRFLRPCAPPPRSTTFPLRKGALTYGLALCAPPAQQLFFPPAKAPSGRPRASTGHLAIFLILTNFITLILHGVSRECVCVYMRVCVCFTHAPDLPLTRIDAGLRIATTVVDCQKMSNKRSPNRYLAPSWACPSPLTYF